MSTMAHMAPDQGLLRRIARIWREADPGLRRRLVAIYTVLIGFNVVIWALLLLTSTRYPLLLGLAPVAFGFGLRHAVDPDHIAAIDNTTRKLMQDGQRPVGVGLFFSLGHSTVVFALSVLIAISAAFVKANLPQMRNVGVVIGTSVSGVFLVVIAVINLVVLVDIYKTWRKVVRGGTYDDQTLDDYLKNRGLIARLLQAAAAHGAAIAGTCTSSACSSAWVSTRPARWASWACRDGGSQRHAGLSVLLLPLLFVAGMSLIDTTDGMRCWAPMAGPTCGRCASSTTT